MQWSLTYCNEICSRGWKKLSIIEAVKEIKVTQEIWLTSWVVNMLDSVSMLQNGTCQMFLSWDGVPRGSEPLILSPSHDANDEVVLMGHSHRVVETLAGEPFPVHLLVLLVCHISEYHRLLLATQHHWGHPSVQSATKWNVWCCHCWMSLDDNVYWNWNTIRSK